MYWSPGAEVNISWSKWSCHQQKSTEVKWCFRFFGSHADIKNWVMTIPNSHRLFVGFQRGPHTANQPLKRPHITRKWHYHIYSYIIFQKLANQSFTTATFKMRQSAMGSHQPPPKQGLQAVVWIQQGCQTSSATVSNLVMTWGMGPYHLVMTFTVCHGKIHHAINR